MGTGQEEKYLLIFLDAYKPIAMANIEFPATVDPRLTVIGLPTLLKTGRTILGNFPDQQFSLIGRYCGFTAVLPQFFKTAIEAIGTMDNYHDVSPSS